MKLPKEILDKILEELPYVRIKDFGEDFNYVINKKMDEDYPQEIEDIILKLDIDDLNKIIYYFINYHSNYNGYIEDTEFFDSLGVKDTLYNIMQRHSYYTDIEHLVTNEEVIELLDYIRDIQIDFRHAIFV